MSGRKDVEVLVQKAREQGWTVTKTKGSHYKWVSPLGGLFFSTSTPSDFRAIDNLKRDMKRYGFIEITKKGRRSR